MATGTGEAKLGADDEEDGADEDGEDGADEDGEDGADEDGEDGAGDEDSAAEGLAAAEEDAGVGPPEPLFPLAFAVMTVAATAAATTPATAASTHLGNRGTTTRMPDRCVGASGFGGSAVIAKVLGSGRPNHRNGPYTATGTSASLPGATSTAPGMLSRNPSARSVGFSMIRSGTLPRLSSVMW